MTKSTKKSTSKKTASKKSAVKKTTLKSTPVHDSADQSTTLSGDSSVAVDVKPSGKDTGRIYHVCQVKCADGQKFQKRFAVDKLPTHAVIVRFAKTKQHHVLTWSRNEKLCASHIRRVKKQYFGDDATVTPNQYDSVVVVEVKDLGLQTSPLDPNLTEDRTWIKINRAKQRIALAAVAPKSVSAASLALATMILSTFCF